MSVFIYSRRYKVNYASVHVDDLNLEMNIFKSVSSFLNPNQTMLIVYLSWHEI